VDYPSKLVRGYHNIRKTHESNYLYCFSKGLQIMCYQYYQKRIHWRWQ